ncbi:class I histocompatibility antigen, F10 alpha chain-like [Hyla sarda]|uniref:class I histocompatibility antigen, F10 alpha chain-like n=1 Tax=Hyla sarda TaxID=327740 RepID=UPI0024C30604|nr:class I histocompatibility antigen, F10 alpha chain-like [Hyla sarda]
MEVKMFSVFVLLLPRPAVYCDSHFLRYYRTTVSVPGSGLPEFSSVGYVDDREIVNYNSETGRYRPKVQWMEKVKPGYWERNTQIAKEYEAVAKMNVKTLMSRFNQTGGLHIVQMMVGCELRDDGFIRVYDQHRYDGREFMSLDTHTWTYIPTTAQAQITAQRWNSPEEQAGERMRFNLENDCIKWLKEYVEYGKEDLERRVRPEVKVSGQERDGILTLQCLAYGFHPKPVDVKWMKNNMDDIPTYKSTHILPNPDGTYQIRVTAEVIPKEGESYSCYVDHSSLGKPLSIVWEKSKSQLLYLCGFLSVALLLLGIIGILLYGVKKQDYLSLVKMKSSHPANLQEIDVASKPAVSILHVCL